MGSRYRMALDPTDLDKVNRSPLFAHLGEDVARVVIGDREPKTYERGRSIFLQGDPADAFFLVRAAAHFVAPSPGGRGAFRDLAELVLFARLGATPLDA